MYGEFPLKKASIKFGKFKLEFKKEGKFFVYRRIEGGKVESEKKVVSSESEVAILPLEPLNLPKRITRFLQIHLKTPLFLEPKVERKVFLTFPLEIGVFLKKKASYKLLDAFSLTKPKYTLYGTPRVGVICRYCESEVHDKIPKVESKELGVLEVSVANRTNDFREVCFMVFDASSLQLFYDDSVVFASAEFRVVSEKVCESNFLSRPLHPRMRKSLKLSEEREIAIPLPAKKFVMEWGAC